MPKTQAVTPRAKTLGVAFRTFWQSQDLTIFVSFDTKVTQWDMPASKGLCIAGLIPLFM